MMLSASYITDPRFDDAFKVTRWNGVYGDMTLATLISQLQAIPSGDLNVEGALFVRNAATIDGGIVTTTISASGSATLAALNVTGNTSLATTNMTAGYISGPLVVSGITTLGGGATAPTMPFGNNSTNVATTAFVQAAVAASGLTASLPMTLFGNAGSTTALPVALTPVQAKTVLAIAASDVGPGVFPNGSYTFGTGTITIPQGALGAATTGVTAVAGTSNTTLATTAFVATNFLTPAAAGATYLTIANAQTTYAPIASPALTGTPTAPTPTTGDNSTKIATTAFVLANAISGGSYAPINSPAFTGNPTAPTPTAGNNSTSLATTSFVAAAIAAAPGASLPPQTVVGNPATAGTGNAAPVAMTPAQAKTVLAIAAPDVAPGTFQASGAYTYPNQLTVGTGALSGGVVTLNGPGGAGGARYVAAFTGGVQRWSFGASGAAEGTPGSNQGSDFFINRANDSGGFIDTPLTITRSSGLTTIADRLTVGATMLTGGFIDITGPGGPGGGRGIGMQTNGSYRWNFLANGTADSATAAGSDLEIRRFDNTGTQIDTPLMITRSSGLVTLADSLTVTNPPSGGTFITALGPTSGTGGAHIVLDSPIVTGRNVWWRTNGSNRWVLFADGATAEGGSNVGSDLKLGMYNDSGVSTGLAFTVTRATGVVGFAAAPTAPTVGKQNGYATGPAIQQLATMQAVGQWGLAVTKFNAVSGSVYPGYGNSGAAYLYNVNTSNSLFLPGDGSAGTYTAVNRSGTTVGIAGLATPPAYNTIPNGGAIIMAADNTGSTYAIATAGYGSVGRVTEVEEDSYLCDEENYFDGNCIHFIGKGNKKLIWGKLYPGARLEVSCEPGATVEFEYAGGTLRSVPQNKTAGVRLQGPGEAVITQKREREIWLRGDVQ